MTTQAAQMTVQLPAELVQRLQQAATEVGMDLPAYLLYLEQCRRGSLDAKAQDAVQFMFSRHGASLRKLGEDAHRNRPASIRKC